MKRCLLLAFCIGILNYAFAQKSESLSISQSALQAAMDQIDIKANRLCGYITEIGSSRSKLTLEEKDDIVYRKVPHLFWMYKEAPRYMTTSSGPGGLTIRRKPMYEYFVALKRQSITPFNKEVRYELLYDKVYSEENMKNLDSWERCEDEDYDNCQVWRQKIRFVQTYYVINYNLSNDLFEIKSAQQIIKTEVDNKYLYVYLIIRKTDGKKIARIGDVYMVERLRTQK